LFGYLQQQTFFSKISNDEIDLPFPRMAGRMSWALLGLKGAGNMRKMK